MSEGGESRRCHGVRGRQVAPTSRLRGRRVAATPRARRRYGAPWRSELAAALADPARAAAPAVEDARTTLSLAELRALAGRVAHAVRAAVQGQSLGRAPSVVVFAPKDVTCVGAMLGVLLAGDRRRGEPTGRCRS